MKCQIYILSTLVFLTTIVQAQGPLPCGNHIIDMSALNQARQFQSSNASRPAVVNSFVRVYFHILKNDDGTNAAATTAQLATEFTTLLASYAADNVCFLNAGTDSINNTFLNTLFNADNDPSGTFFSPYQVPGCVNIFYTSVIKGNNPACNPPCGYGGISLGGIPGTFFLVGNANIGKGATISHEMGHCLGLLHTFETSNGFEKIDGSNSSTTGDLITDTPADPFAYNGNSCYATSGCSYAGVCVDSSGANDFTPPYTNLMAYWWNVSTGCYPNLVTTNNQFALVNSVLATYNPIINCSSSPFLTLNAINVSAGYYMSSAIFTYTTNGNVRFHGSAKVTLGGGSVFLEPGFRADPGTGGKVRIEPKPCN